MILAGKILDTPLLTVLKLTIQLVSIEVLVA